MSKPKKVSHCGSCFVCGAVPDQENNAGVKVGRFLVTKDRLPVWEKLIPKAGMKIGSSLCSRHFDSVDIIKGREIGGIFYPFKLWKLNQHAVPKHLLCKPDGDCPAGPHNSAGKKTGTKKRNPFSECHSENRQLLTPRASKNDALTDSSNTFHVQPEHLIVVDRHPVSDVVPTDQMVSAPADVLAVEAVTAEGNETARHHAIEGDFSVRLPQFESTTNDADRQPTDQHLFLNIEFHGNQAEGNDALDPHNAMDQEPPVIAVTETATTDAVCLPMDLEPTVSDTTTCNEIPSDSVNPSPLSENNPSLPNVPGTSNFDFESLTRVVKLPGKWRWDYADQTCYNMIKTGKECVIKIVWITTMLLSFYINGKEVILPFLKNKLWAPLDLQRAVNEFDQLQPCSGMLNLASYCDLNAGKLRVNIGHSLKCKSVCNRNEKQCSNCRVDEGKLKYLKRTQSQTVASLTKRLKANQRRVQRFIGYGKNAALTVNCLRRRIESLSANQLSEKIKHLPHQVSIQTITR